ncbi:hypothetical protein LTS12_028986 [Elasticomyces elasticus]|nr:hypothetical protein LTS12_028986 [Elasticomyces elasticus]
MVTPSPVLLFVPGAATYPSFYDDLKIHIQSSGIDFHTFKLATVDARQPAASLQNDVDLVRSLLADFCDQGRDIFMMGHSYGGLPMTESARGFTQANRRKAGKEGGIVHLIYITALAPDVGESMESTNASQHGSEGPLIFNFMIDHGDYFGQDPEGSASVNFNALPREVAVAHGRKMALHSKLCFRVALTYAAYADIPTSYIKVLRDNCLPPWWQQARIETIQKYRGDPIDVYNFDSDHCFQASFQLRLPI